MRHLRRRTFHGRRSGDNREVNSVMLWQGPEISGPCLYVNNLKVAHVYNSENLSDL